MYVPLIELHKVHTTMRTTYVCYAHFQTSLCMLTCIIIVYTGENEENERKSAKRSSEIGGKIGGKQGNKKHLEHKNDLSILWKQF